MPRHRRSSALSSSRSDLYEEITIRIIAELEEGRVPWVQPWSSDGSAATLDMPRNATTERRYTGINILILWPAVVEGGYASQSWLTFRQALSLGGCVRRGERGTTVVYADRFVPDEERRRVQGTGDQPNAIPFLKRFTVFNVAQCDGLPDELTAVPPPVAEGLILPQVDALIAASGAMVRIGGSQAFYAPEQDVVQVPRPEDFHQPIDWHRTVLHELGHWTGAKHRLARDLSGGFGSEAYAKEELVAEMSAAFTCATLGIEPKLRVERGYVRPEDEPPVEPEVPESTETASGGDGTADAVGGTIAPVSVTGTTSVTEPEDEDGIRPLPDRLVSELTAHRTVALRDAVGRDFDVAFLACLHALVLRTFYPWSRGSCLEIEAKSVSFPHQPAGLAETTSAVILSERHERYAEALPDDADDLWDVLVAIDEDTRRSLFAHCVAMTVNATHDAYVRRPQAMAHADVLAQAVGLDMVAAGWRPTADSYLGQVTKARIVDAVRDGVGDQAAESIAGLKKDAMVVRAEALLADSGWLPEPLRTPGVESGSPEGTASVEAQPIAAE